MEEQLRQIQTERNNLKIEKEQAEAVAEQEKTRANNYQQQLKTINKLLHQWQKKELFGESKINYCQQLEKEKKQREVKIIQTPPWKPSK